ncbi:hypothetical protein [Candidatus Methylacidithermus pantelleriae]|nr:hypothetical protein [Candidatus Methylacidithermus pantelleriae]
MRGVRLLGALSLDGKLLTSWWQPEELLGELFWGKRVFREKIWTDLWPEGRKGHWVIRGWQDEVLHKESNGRPLWVAAGPGLATKLWQKGLVERIGVYWMALVGPRDTKSWSVPFVPPGPARALRVCYHLEEARMAPHGVVLWYRPSSENRSLARKRKEARG